MRETQVLGSKQYGIKIKYKQIYTYIKNKVKAIKVVQLFNKTKNRINKIQYTFKKKEKALTKIHTYIHKYITLLYRAWKMEIRIN